MAKIKVALPPGTPVEVWFQDEARIGQKNKIAHRWAMRGTRPSAPKDQRMKSAYIFGDICSELGKGADLVLPFCDTQTMSLHLAEISLAIEPDAHGVLLMDQAGWHMTGKREVPENNSIIPWPPKCAERSLVENIWQFMPNNWLSNRIFTSLRQRKGSAVDSGRDYRGSVIVAKKFAAGRAARYGERVLGPYEDPALACKITSTSF